jgi:hypothetical protein
MLARLHHVASSLSRLLAPHLHGRSARAVSQRLGSEPPSMLLLAIVYEMRRMWKNYRAVTNDETKKWREKERRAKQMSERGGWEVAAVESEGSEGHLRPMPGDGWCREDASDILAHAGPRCASSRATIDGTACLVGTSLGQRCERWMRAQNKSLRREKTGKSCFCRIFPQLRLQALPASRAGTWRGQPQPRVRACATLYTACCI